jgi:transposase
MTRVAKFVGLDVHKDTICIAWAEGGPLQVPTLVGTVPHDVPRLVKQLLRIAPAEHLWVVYEAGPTGFGLARTLMERGIRCMVVAPNRVPHEPGNRVKTDKRDARDLARALRAGNLRGIALPEVEQEAVRDLLRAREDCVRALRSVRQQLQGFLLRNGVIWKGGSSWTGKYFEWLRGLRFSAEAQSETFKHYLGEVDRLVLSRDYLSAEVGRLVLTLAQAPLYRALQALRGVSTIVAATVVCEIGDLRRFPSASRLMSFVGLTPSEYSSGGKHSRGSITKAGNGHVRRALVEAAWAGRLLPNRTQQLKRRQVGLDPAVIDIAWKAQHRLHKRYIRLRVRGRPQNLTIVALARELAGFIWAIGQKVEQPAAV